MSSQDTAIEVKNLSKDFILPHKDRKTLKSFFLNPFSKVRNEKQHALDNISFEIKNGDFFGIVGRNGSGKSTLLKCIAGVYHPTKGHIKVNGSLVPFIELGVGFNPELTGRENVFLNGSLLGFSRQEMDAMYDEIVEFSELERFMDQKLKNYSSGMQVRLAFSIAIQAKGDILLLDEVLAVGDAAFQQKCNTYFEELKTKQQTVVLVSHNMQAIQRFCNKAAYITDGRLTAQGTSTEISNLYIEDNIKNARKGAEKNAKLSDSQSLAFKISKQTSEEILLDFSYASNDKSDMYVAISIIKDGMAFAEITTPEDKKLNGNGKISFLLNTNQLNGGVYEISAVLCRWKNRARLTVPKNNVTFSLDKPDITRGSALHLEDTWNIKN